MGGKLKWISFKYVKVPEFCYACGLLGHVYRGCSLYKDDVPETEFQYGPIIRGSPIKRKRRGIEDEWLEDRKKLFELRSEDRGNRVRMNSSHCGRLLGTKTVEEEGLQADKTVKMVIKGWGLKSRSVNWLS